MIRVTHLVKKYGDLIEVNEIFASPGPNGAGSTSTIKY